MEKEGSCGDDECGGETIDEDAAGRDDGEEGSRPDRGQKSRPRPCHVEEHERGRDPRGHQHDATQHERTTVAGRLVSACIGGYSGT